MKNIKYFYLLIFLFFAPIISSGQTLKLITTLDNSIRETSGLIFINNRLITHNDSGDEPALYEIDALNGKVVRKVYISNATNVDWEDICNDDEFIYIGDFGNNRGNRRDLKIYKISIEEYLTTSTDSIEATVINFSYNDQKDFSIRNRAHNFDAETLINYQNKLFLFTKNWENLETRIYAVSKIPGDYIISYKDSIDVQGLITGGVYNAHSNTIWLSGYKLFKPFVIKISHFDKTDFSEGIIIKKQFETKASKQIESICFYDSQNFYLSGEEDFYGPSALYTLNGDIFFKNTTILKAPVSIYPNPVDRILKISLDSPSEISIYSINGRLVLTTQSNTIDISILSKGLYLIIITQIKSGKTSKYSLLKQ